MYCPNFGIRNKFIRNEESTFFSIQCSTSRYKLVWLRWVEGSVKSRPGVSSKSGIVGGDGGGVVGRRMCTEGDGAGDSD